MVYIWDGDGWFGWRRVVVKCVCFVWFGGCMMRGEMRDILCVLY